MSEYLSCDEVTSRMCSVSNSRGRPSSRSRRREGPPHPNQVRPVHGRTEQDRNRRTFGQNFLRDRRFITWIAESAGLNPGLPVIEAGPGEGLLTEALAKRGRGVTAYEIDPRLAATFRKRFADRADIDIVPGDFLESEPPREPFAFVGAIPYGITSAIVDWCLDAPSIVSATMVTQLEFARKRTGEYGRWSKRTVLTWPRFEWAFVGKIDRRLFRPVPKVDSAILRLRRRDPELLSDARLAHYKDLVELGFSGIGGSVRASLQRRHPRRRVAAALEHAEIGQDTMVAFVHPDQWLLIFDRLDS